MHMAANNERYAYLAWPALCGCAAQQSVITYTALGEQIHRHFRHLGSVLSVIQDYCLQERLPPLTILVVKKTTGHPGDGFIAWNADDIPTGKQQVYAYNWAALRNPFSFASDGSTQQNLAERLVDAPEEAGEVYRRVMDRGLAQSMFRQALLNVYEHQCAFCRLSFEVALDAAHIISWSKSSQEQRMDVKNGLLLCSVHHELFDAGVMTVDSEGIIHVADAAASDVESQMDEAMTTDLDGEPIFMPGRDDHRPSVEALEWRWHYAAAS